MPTPTLRDRVKETSATTGTVTLNLAGAVTSFRGFVAAGCGGKQVPYLIEGQVGTASAGQWEVGYGTVTDASPDTLSRDTVVASSNAAPLVNFGAGDKTVGLIMTADELAAARADVTAGRVTMRW